MTFNVKTKIWGSFWLIVESFWFEVGLLVLNLHSVVCPGDCMYTSYGGNPFINSTPPT